MFDYDTDFSSGRMVATVGFLIFGCTASVCLSIAIAVLFGVGFGFMTFGIISLALCAVCFKVNYNLAKRDSELDN